MKLDNSQMKAFHIGPWYWKEKYVNKIERRIKTSDALAFGKRVHHLLEGRLRRMKWKNWVDAPCEEPFEPEAQVMLAAYEQQYPTEDFEVVDVERYFEVPLPGTAHIYNGKIDGVVRSKETGMLDLFEHKTEKRGSKANLPEAWALRPQASLYLWAAEQLYKEPFDRILLDVLTRQSPAGQIGPTFLRQKLVRDDEQKENAVRDIIWVADQMERTLAEFGDQEAWPCDKEQCCVMNWKCEFYQLHTFGRNEFTLANDYQAVEEYLRM